jgi:hypothetical protein
MVQDEGRLHTIQRNQEMVQELTRQGVHKYDDWDEGMAASDRTQLCTVNCKPLSNTFEDELAEYKGTPAGHICTLQLLQMRRGVRSSC